jgi:uncharacterized protein (TIGR04222 family)
LIVNPFDYSGPVFLVFYAALCLAVCAWVHMRLRSREGEFPVPQLDMTDPYQIAYLRGGANEAIRIAVFSLIDRGLLDISDPKEKKPQAWTHSAEGITLVRRDIEKAVLRFFAKTQPAVDALASKICIAACGEYEKVLGEARLIVTPEVIKDRRWVFMMGTAVVVGVGIVKLCVALSRGHNNVAILLMMLFFFPVLLFQLTKSHTTVLGSHVLKDLKTLFRPLYDRRLAVEAGGLTNEAALLAAVFGIGVLPGAFRYIQQLYPRAAATGGTGCGAGCGSGGGGGGGCGGGCGGCGGG